MARRTVGAGAPSWPDDLLERELMAAGHAPVAGVDEAGRGPLAGPVVAAAVILDPARPIAGLNDSKKLSPGRREELLAAIRAHALGVGVALLPPVEIDRLNILRAALAAMARAVAALPLPPAFLLVDGNRLPSQLPCPARAVVKGDGRCLSIAAASIVAKVTRDRVMGELARRHPGYGWENNAGYPTAGHLEALERLGVTPQHRRSFGPVARLLARAGDAEGGAGGAAPPGP